MENEKLFKEIKSNMFEMINVKAFEGNANLKGNNYGYN